MKVELKWTGGMKFQADCEGHSVPMDAKTPIGQGSAMTPKELVAAGLAGCTIMDVAALLKKHKQNYDKLEISADVTSSSGGQPVVFEKVLLTYSVTGAVDKNILIESVTLSQTKYCGVSAMLSKAFPITYAISLNGEIIGEGAAHF